MRRMPPDRRLSTLVERGAAGSRATCGTSPTSSPRSTPGASAAAAADAAAAGRTGGALARQHRASLEASSARWSTGAVDVAPSPCRYLDGRDPLFDHRVADGRACDGHGDLLGRRHLLPRRRPPGARLHRVRRRAALRRRRWPTSPSWPWTSSASAAPSWASCSSPTASHADDVWPASLGAPPHRLPGPGPGQGARPSGPDQGDAASRPEARRLLDRRRPPRGGTVRLVLVGGLPGTGKSTLAGALGRALGRPCSAPTRCARSWPACPSTGPRRTSSAGASTPPRPPRAPTASCCRAGVALGMGETVVLDASWSDEVGPRPGPGPRRPRLHADLVELRCEVAAEVAAERMPPPAAAGGGASDASRPSPPPWPRSPTPGRRP